VTAAAIEAALGRLGLAGKATPVEGAGFPTWSLRLGSARVAVSAAGSMVAVSARVATGVRPEDAELFHELLAANARLSGASFGLDEDGSIAVWYTRPAHGLSDKVLAFMIGQVGDAADAWDEKLRARSG
jgi:hypothetical protein